MTDTIAELIDSKKHRELKTLIAETNAIDLAEELEKLSQEQRIILFRSLPKNAAADIFSYLSPETKENLIELLTDPELAHIVNDLFLDDAVDFIEEMPANVVKRVLKNASDDTRKQINQLLQYHEDSAGSIMTTEYIDLKENMTVEDAFRRIRQVGVDKETVYTCYVTDARRILDGVVTIRKLLLSETTDKIGDIMTPNVISVTTGDDRERAAELFQKYDLVVLPVVDTERHLVGIITVDDAMEVLEEENTEDFQIMAAMEP
ncbi:MAG: magnesium transporter, partial [Synergistaceae bacterium]|nr:magnesium transporter [Synergistaceae bacterium]